jgi:hypothetical protein
MKKIKLRKGNARIKDVVSSTPKTTHVKDGDVVRSSPKTTHPKRIKNLGKYAYPSRLPSGQKIGAAVKVKLRKSNKVKGY